MSCLAHDPGCDDAVAWRVRPIEVKNMLLSVVLPALNEAEALPLTLSTLRGVLEPMDCDWEILVVNDGSQDDTFEILRRAAESDRRIKVINFSRSFGHQAAITAGIDFAEGDAVVMMDADLQDPPEILLPMQIGRASCRERV